MRIGLWILISGIKSIRIYRLVSLSNFPQANSVCFWYLNDQLLCYLN